jgi:hypothetical protein
MAGGSPDRRQGVARPPQRRLTRQRLKSAKRSRTVTVLAR